MRINSLMVSILLVLGLAGWANSQDAALTTANGVFTQEQAERGQTAFLTNCVMCHTETLIPQDSDVPALSGSRFRTGWVGKTLANRYMRIKMMPMGRAGELNEQEYIDLLAFILAFNGQPAGDEELVADPELLKLITISATPE